MKKQSPSSNPAIRSLCPRHAASALSAVSKACIHHQTSLQAFKRLKKVPVRACTLPVPSSYTPNNHMLVRLSAGIMVTHSYGPVGARQLGKSSVTKAVTGRALQREQSSPETRPSMASKGSENRPRLGGHTAVQENLCQKLCEVQRLMGGEGLTHVGRT